MELPELVRVELGLPMYRLWRLPREKAFYGTLYHGLGGSSWSDDPVPSGVQVREHGKREFREATEEEKLALAQHLLKEAAVG